MNRKIMGLFMSLLLVLGLFPAVIHAQDEENLPLYRLYNPHSGEHFYTTNEEEKNYLDYVGWDYETIGWYVPQSGDPVYRLFNPNVSDHHYTLDAHERDVLVKLGWRYEGIGWYSSTDHSIPVYREYNPNAVTGMHNFTTSMHEHTTLVKLGWHDEGTAFYAAQAGYDSDNDPNNQLLPLHVDGTHLLNSNNKEMVLQGYSTFGLAWMPEYVNENVFSFLKNQMGSDIVRLAMYTEEYGGYCNGGNKQQLLDVIDRGVKAAKATDQYVIIDWHILSDGNPNTHLNEAKDFFNQVSSKYASESHVLYEICNEPNGVDWQQVKSYAQQVIPVIRSHDPDAVILVGTPTWSQDVDTAANDPITGYDNLMYTLHFYAATHKENIQNKLTTAHNKGLPVFVSEFGISSADGNGGIDTASGDKWISLLNQYGISRVGWSLSNKNESSAMFNPGSSVPPTLNDLSASGKWFHQTYTGSSSTTDPTPTPNPDPQPEPDPTPNQPLQVSLELKNSWTENNALTGQYSLTITNPNASAVDGWTIKLSFNEQITVENSWNCSVSSDGHTLTITPASYNSQVAASGSVTDIGLIIHSSSSTLTPSNPAVS